MERIAELLGNRGVGLFIDYGNNHTSKNTLRVCKKDVAGPFELNKINSNKCRESKIINSLTF